MKILCLFIIPLVLFSTSAAQACFAPAPEQTSPWPELVKRTDTIVLAQVVSAQPAVKTESTTPAATHAILESDEGNTIFKLKVLETLKGHSNPTFEMTGNLANEKAERTFAKHADKAFWSDGTGRSIISPDCTIKPAFTVGEKYLLFVEKPYHVKSFEKVSDSKDLWLQKVKSLVHIP